MKILYITNYDSMYGANLSLCGMMAELKRSYGILPFVLCPGGGELKQELDKLEIPCFCLGFRISYWPDTTACLKVRRLTRRIMRYKDFYQILMFFRKKNLHFDMVHSNTSVTDVGSFLARKWKIPHIWHVREFAKEHFHLISVLSKRALSRQYRRAGKVIAVSEAIARKVEEYGRGVSISIIYNGIPIVPAYHKEYCVDGYVNFCIVGSISSGKNQMEVVKAAEQIDDAGYSNFRLYIAGDDKGEYYEEIRRYIDGKKFGKNIVFTGYIREMQPFLKTMDIGIMASEKEAFGRVTVEYMENYMPVIASDSGGTPELLCGKGITYSVHDIGQLANCMRWCCEHTESFGEMGRELRKISEGFSVERNAGNIYNVYKSIIDLK